tara:strand:+ start:3679 stop:4359 length:681 start_codon:yes stop_codon:yes gene_type:complete
MLIYLTDIKQMPRWDKIHGSLEDVFDYGSRQEYKDIQDLKLFGLYKDEKRDVRHNVHHPIDYVSHDVRIVIGEFDSVEHLKTFRPDNSRVAKELDRENNISLMKIKFPIMQQKHKSYCDDEYTNRLFNKLSKDERILFCYVTTSGKGIRFGFELDERIDNDLEYISNYYFYGKEFLKHDDKNRFGIEYNASSTGSFYELGNITSVYWFLPITDKWHVKESVRLKKL